LLQTKHFPDFDPWVTHSFPLGHPEFSTGSPNLFHWVTQASPNLYARQSFPAHARSGDLHGLSAQHAEGHKNPKMPTPGTNAGRLIHQTNRPHVRTGFVYEQMTNQSYTSFSLCQQKNLPPSFSGKYRFDQGLKADC
jgi:hypothetical protein